MRVVGKLPGEKTSNPGRSTGTEQGSQYTPNTRDPYGHGVERRRVLLEGSPEHLLLKEAKAIGRGDWHCLRRKEDPLEAESEPQNEDYSQNPREEHKGIGNKEG